MTTSVLVLSGPIASGKTALAEKIAARLGYYHVRIRSLLQKDSGLSEAAATRGDLQNYGAVLEARTAGRWLVERVLQLVAGEGTRGVVIDSARTSAQVRRLREQLGEELFHVHLTADQRVLAHRFEARRGASSNEASTYSAAISHGIEQEEPELRALADKVIDTSRLDPETVYQVALSSVRA